MEPLNLQETLYSGVSYREINMEGVAGWAAPAGREENNHLNDCRTFKMSRVGGGGGGQQEGSEGNKRFSSVAESENEMGWEGGWNPVCLASIIRVIKQF